MALKRRCACAAPPPPPPSVEAQETAFSVMMLFGNYTFWFPIPNYLRLIRWNVGLQVEPKRKYVKIVDVPFRLTNVALGPSCKEGESATLLVSSAPQEEYAICTLVGGKVFQHQTDLEFGVGDEISFFLNCSAGFDSVLHLTGINMEEPYGSGESDEFDSEDDDEEFDNEENSSDMDEDDEDSDEGNEVEELSGSDEEQEGSEEEEEESEEEQPVKPAAKQNVASPNDKRSLNNAAAVAAAAPNKKNKPAEQPQKQQPQQQAAQKKAAEPQAKQQPAQKPAAKASAPEESAKTLPNGLIIEDLKKGNGKPVKAGQKVSVAYVGKLKNGKVFDSCNENKPFKFTLGRQQVIKGWDLGLEGMSVGGKRKLVIPAALAYGSKSPGAGIPPNAELTFEVSLVNAN